MVNDPPADNLVTSVLMLEDGQPWSTQQTCGLGAHIQDNLKWPSPDCFCKTLQLYLPSCCVHHPNDHCHKQVPETRRERAWDIVVFSESHSKGVPSSPPSQSLETPGPCCDHLCHQLSWGRCGPSFVLVYILIPD